MVRPDLPDSVFYEEGGRLVPTAIARGPWDPNAQHGGAPAALLARAVERFEPGPASYVARLTIELLRPVPIAPLEVRTGMLRPGKRVQLVEASLLAGGREVARATGLRLREKPLELPADARVVESSLPGPETGEPVPFDVPVSGGLHFALAMDVVATRGGIRVPGPSTLWFRLAVPIVAGEEPSPLMRVAAAADFGNGISAVVDWTGGWMFINPDLTVYLNRHPVGEWVALDAITYAEPSGVGIAEVALSDVKGRIGRSVQSILIDGPEAGPGADLDARYPDI